MVILEHFFPVYFWLFMSLKTVMTFPCHFFWLSWWLKKPLIIYVIENRHDFSLSFWLIISERKKNLCQKY